MSGSSQQTFADFGGPAVSAVEAASRTSGHEHVKPRPRGLSEAAILGCLLQRAARAFYMAQHWSARVGAFSRPSADFGLHVQLIHYTSLAHRKPLAIPAAG